MADAMCSVKKNIKDQNTIAAAANRRTRVPENLALVRRIGELLHAYTEDEIAELVAKHLASVQPSKGRPRGRSARKK